MPKRILSVIILATGLLILCLATDSAQATPTWCGGGTGTKTATDPADPTTQWNVQANWVGGTVGQVGMVLLPLDNAGYVFAPKAGSYVSLDVRVDGPSDLGAFCIRDGNTQPFYSYLRIGLTQKGRAVQTGGSFSTANELRIGDGGTGTYEFDNGTLTSHKVYIGAGGTGLFWQKAGTHTVSGTAFSIGASGGHGTYQLDNGLLDVQNASEVVGGNSGTGSFLQTGGTHQARAGITINSTGTYELQGGQLTAATMLSAGVYLNGGYFHQTGGTFSVPLSQSPLNINTGGTYLLDNGSLTAYVVTLGHFGAGTFRQNGGIHSAGTLSVGGDSTGPYHSDSSSYELNAGALSTYHTYVASYAGGQFLQTGGTHTVSNDLWLGLSPTSGGGYPGSYDLQGGCLTVGTEHAGNSFDFHQTGGTHTVVNNMSLYGLYSLDNGSLTSFGSFVIPNSPDGGFRQTGGTNIVRSALNVASASPGTRSYELDNGVLTVGPEGDWPGLYVAGSYGDYGMFTQKGGVLTVHGWLSLFTVSGNSTYNLSGGSLSTTGTGIGGGYAPCNGTATMNISGGSFTTGALSMGTPGTTSTLNITNPSAYVAVGAYFSLGDCATLHAVAGSTIHMKGANFLNQSLHPSMLAGMDNLTLLFEGGPAHTDTFEAAGKDFGRSLKGYSVNFGLGKLALGSADNIGIVQLIDSFNNGNTGGPGGAAEALYVNSLALTAGSTLDLNGLHLYVRGIEDNGATILNGSLISMLAGDANGDFKIDGSDLAAWQQNYDPLGANADTFAMGDWNGDGKIDGADLALWQQNYSPLPLYTPSGDMSLSLNAVPEPATMLLVGSALLTLAGIRRRRQLQ